MFVVVFICVPVVVCVGTCFGFCVLWLLKQDASANICRRVENGRRTPTKTHAHEAPRPTRWRSARGGSARLCWPRWRWGELSFSVPLGGGEGGGGGGGGRGQGLFWAVGRRFSWSLLLFFLGGEENPSSRQREWNPREGSGRLFLFVYLLGGEEPLSPSTKARGSSPNPNHQSNPPTKGYLIQLSPNWWLGLVDLELNLWFLQRPHGNPPNPPTNPNHH